MSNSKYSFENDYDSLSSIYCPFEVKNRFGDIIIDPDFIAGFTSSPANISGTYTGQFGGFTVSPRFLSADPRISDVRYFVDFGDGTTSRNTLSSFHQYNLPGDYNITLIVYTSGGESFRSSQMVNLKVRDVVSDKIILTKSGNSQNLSESTVVFYVARWNNATSSNVMSGSNYRINLSVKGNQTPIVNQNLYLNDDTFQYTVSSFFFNEIGNKFKVIDSVETTSSDIYAEYVNKDIVFSYEPKISNYFVGTSGYGSFLYYEPLTNISSPFNN